MGTYRKKPLEIEAVRYGQDDTGAFYSGAVDKVVRFMLGLGVDDELAEWQRLSVIKPTGWWDPDMFSDIWMWDGIAHGEWLPLAVGDWVIKGVQGEFYPCKPDIFNDTYDEVADD